MRKSVADGVLTQVQDSWPRHDDGSELDVAEKNAGEFSVTGGEAAAVFEAAGRALNGVAALVKWLAEAVRPVPIGLWRDVWNRALLLDQVADMIAVTGAVGTEDATLRQAFSRCSAPRLTPIA